MTWVRLDDGFCDHPKVGSLSDRSFRAHVRALCYAARFSPGIGALSARAIKVLGMAPATVSELAGAGLWEEADDGYVIHDFPTYNPRQDPTAKAEAGRLGGLAKASRILAGASGQDLAEPSSVLAGASGKQASKTLAKSSSRVPPVPYPSPTRPQVVVPDDDDDFGDVPEIPQPVREMRDAVLAKLPAKFRNDSEQWDAAESFARDFAGQWAELQVATDAVRRIPNRQPFPGALREFMPKPATPEPPRIPASNGLRSAEELFPTLPDRGTPEWDAYVREASANPPEPIAGAGPWVTK